MTAPKRTRRTRSILFIEIILIIAALFIAAIVYMSGKMKRITWKDSDIYMNDVNDDNMSGYTNIALFGVDSRENELTKKTRSDSIIIASINNKTHDVKLVSIYRDTFVYIPKHGYTKLNHAYAYGGPKLAIETINRNFDMNITDFITINFSGLTDVIDALGGVTIRIKKDAQKMLLISTKKNGLKLKLPANSCLPVCRQPGIHASAIQKAVISDVPTDRGPLSTQFLTKQNTPALLSLQKLLMQFSPRHTQVLMAWNLPACPSICRSMI